MPFVHGHLDNAFYVVLTLSQAVSDVVPFRAVPESSVNVLGELVGKVLLYFSDFLECEKRERGV